MIRILEYGIDADEHNYISGIIKSRKGKNGKTQEYIYQPKYHRTIAQACESLLQRYQRSWVESHTMEMKTALIELQAITQAFQEAITKIEETEKGVSE